MIYLELFFTFLMIGAFTFGGGYAMLPLIQEEVAAKGWVDAAALVDFVAVSESTPGPFAINMATYVGSVVGGEGVGVWGSILGAACATLGVVVPSFVVILIVARCFRAFCASKWVKGVMSGLKPAVVGLIASAAATVGGTALFGKGEMGSWFWFAVTAVMAFVAFKWKKLHPIVIICICALIGIAAGYMGL